MPDYSLEELRKWMLAQPNFESLYQAWISTGFNKMQKPSVDRIDDYKPYSLDNIQLTTWAENNARGHADIKNGINNKISKSVFQLTKDGSFIDRHYSAIHAGRVTGVDFRNISRCCRGEAKTAGGFVWHYCGDNGES